MLKLKDANGSHSQNASALKPLAIVGMACRLPGGCDDTESFWHLLRTGTDAVVDVPADRWNKRDFCDPSPHVVGKMQAPRGGFLRRPLDLFDASFFSMSPNEAARLDPQQRMLMETAWECLEDAGQPVQTLAGSNTGVFIGGFMLDSMLFQLGRDNVDVIGPHTATGMTMTMLSARLAYYFDLRGPTLTIDTACSSSLVAVHYACMSLWNEECSMALVGGVNAMLAPAMSIALAKAKLTSPDGRSKAFDILANGYGRGEGAGIILLKPLDRALADGDRVYAVIRGSAVNQDGRSENAITTPSREAQVDVLQKAYGRAGVAPQTVQYVEAHGTGTAVGDKTEATALGTVLGTGRAADAPLCIGSVKTNVGHLEGAAGITGLIKATLALHNEAIPPNLHFNNPNPNIDFAQLRLRVATGLTPWPRAATARYAGVNSFGYGGTNAHIVLEEAPVPAPAAARSLASSSMLPISARSGDALRELGARYAAQVERLATASDLEDIAYSAGVRRSHLDERAVVIGASAQDMGKALSALAQGQEHPGLVRGARAEQQPRLAWVFTGMGPQWPGMGQELLREEPVFRAAVEGLDAAFLRHCKGDDGGWSLVNEMMAPESGSRMQRTEIAMSCNLAMQVGLAALWQSWGFRPDLIIGHSVGEMAAAYVAGALSLDDVALLAWHRSRLMRLVPSGGGMLAVGVSEKDARDLIAGVESSVSMAAINSATSVVLSGDMSVLKRIAEGLEARGTFHRFMRVEVPFHSPAMDPLKDALAKALQELRPQMPSIPLYSTVLAKRVDQVVHDANYWVRNLREPVFFHQAALDCMASDMTHLLEVGPHPVLAGALKDVAQEAGGRKITVVASAVRQKAERETMLRAAARLFVDGWELGWKALYSPAARFVATPKYPWQRRVHWAESEVSHQQRLRDDERPLIGSRLPVPETLWEGEITEARYPYMRDHNVAGEVLFPASGYLQAALNMLGAPPEDQDWVLNDVELLNAMVLGEGAVQHLHGHVEESAQRFSFHSRSGSSGEWLLNVKGRYKTQPRNRPRALDLKGLRAAMRQTSSGEQVYAQLQRRGYAYGSTFRQVQQLYRKGQELLGEIVAPASVALDDGPQSMHPAILDACLHASLYLLPSNNDTTYLPVAVGQLVLHQSLPARVWVHIKVQQSNAQRLVGDFVVCAENGDVLLEMYGLEARALATASAGLAQPLDSWAYSHTWQRLSETLPIPATIAGRWLICGDAEAGQRLMRMVRARGGTAQLIIFGTTAQTHEDGTLEVRGENAEDFTRALAGSKLAHAVPERVVYMREMQTSEMDASHGSEATGGAAATRLLTVLRCLLQAEFDAPPQVTVVTRGTTVVSGERVFGIPRSGGLAGFVRTVANEHTELRMRHIDLPVQAGDEDSELLLAQIVGGTAEHEVALRHGHWYARRFRSVDTRAVAAEAHCVAQRQRRPFVAMASQSRNDAALSFRWRTPEEAMLARGQVEIEVDTAWAASAGAAPLLQAVCGTVTRIGEGTVTQVAVGDAVMAWGGQGAASHIRADARCVRAKPQALSATRFAELGGHFVAHLLMHEVVHLQHGSSVVMDGRHLGRLVEAFADVVQANDGKLIVLLDKDRTLPPGCVAVNTNDPACHTLLHQAAAANAVRLGVFVSEDLHEAWTSGVSPGGTLAVMGKPSRAGFHGQANMSLLHVDIEQLAAHQPELMGRVLETVAHPAATFKATGAVLRLDELARPDLLGGGSAVDLSVEGIPISEVAHEEFRCSTDRTYLITGAFGGLGLVIAKWLVARGARHLLLLGRNGAVSDEAKAALERFASTQVQVYVGKVDIADSAALQACLENAAQSLPALGGVIHAASTFNSEFVFDTEPASLSPRMAPKALGAWNLHTLTQSVELEFFLMVSSMAAQIGSHGQAAYAAANAFLDELVTYRRRLGQAGTSVSLGAISDVGILSQREEYGRHLEKSGLLTMTPAQVIETLQFALSRRLDRITVSHMDWPGFFRAFPYLAGDKTFGDLKNGVAEENKSATGSAEAFREALEKAALPERNAMLVQALRDIAATVFGTTAELVDPGVSLQRMGLDSLLAAQLREQIEGKLGLEVRIMTVVRGPSLAQLTDTLLAQLTTSKAAEAAAPAKLVVVGRVEVSALDAELEQVQNMSAQSVAEELQRLETGKVR